MKETTNPKKQPLLEANGSRTPGLKSAAGRVLVEVCCWNLREREGEQQRGETKNNTGHGSKDYLSLRQNGTLTPHGG